MPKLFEAKMSENTEISVSLLLNETIEKLRIVQMTQGYVQLSEIIMELEDIAKVVEKHDDLIVKMEDLLNEFDKTFGHLVMK